MKLPENLEEPLPNSIENYEHGFRNGLKTFTDEIDAIYELMLKREGDLRKENKDLKAKLEIAIKTLEFYADYNSYDHIPATSHPECMAFVGFVLENEAGDLARQALKDINNE